MANIHDLKFFITPAHECSYLPEQQASTLFADPNTPMDNLIYGTLSEVGFRRSGEHVYRPHCQACEACIPIRVPVSSFQLTRQQQRIMKKNSDLLVTEIHGQPQQEHYQLYEKYISLRHHDGDMYPPNEKQFQTFLFSRWSDTHAYEFRTVDDNTLIAVAVTDYLQTGLSAVYTFFDPDHDKRSLGVYAVLWEIERAKALRLPYLYLGYWVKQCQKMSYKTNYRPLEMFINNRWIALL